VIVMFLGLLVTVLVARRLRRARRLRLRQYAPLAGLDTGVRSPWRTPNRLFRPHRGF
jgi:hypothetical protein